MNSKRRSISKFFCREESVFDLHRDFINTQGFEWLVSYSFVKNSPGMLSRAMALYGKDKGIYK